MNRESLESKMRVLKADRKAGDKEDKGKKGSGDLSENNYE